MFTISVNLRDELDSFASAVNRGKYSPIPYKAWQEVCRISKAEQFVKINFDCVGGYYVITIFPEKYTPIQMTHCNNFNELRRFLKYRYIDIEKSTDYKTEPNYEAQKLLFVEEHKKSMKENKKIKSKGENTTMNIKPNINFDFGPIANDTIRMSPYGLAVRSGDSWVTYNTVTKQTVDVTGFVFDFGKFIYKMPVATKDVKIGDMIMHQGNPVYVTDIDEDTSLYVVDILASENKNVIPVTNMFGFNFVTKIVSLMNLNGSTPSADQPFGNIMPMLIWSSILGDGEDGGDFFGNMSMEKLMMFSMFSGQSNPFASVMNLGGMFGFAAPAQE